MTVGQSECVNHKFLGEIRGFQIHMEKIRGLNFFSEIRGVKFIWEKIRGLKIYPEKNKGSQNFGLF